MKVNADQDSSFEVSDPLTTDWIRRNNQPTMRPACWSKMRVLPTRSIGLTSRSQSRWPYQPSQRGSYQPARLALPADHRDKA